MKAGQCGNQRLSFWNDAHKHQCGVEDSGRTVLNPDRATNRIRIFGAIEFSEEAIEERMSAWL
jgi:hypothetical protein